jgi:hypothetical protein
MTATEPTFVSLVKVLSKKIKSLSGLFVNRCGLTVEKALSKLLRLFLKSSYQKVWISQQGFRATVSNLQKNLGNKAIVYLNSESMASLLADEKLSGLPRVVLLGGSDHDCSPAEYRLMQQNPKTIFYVQNLSFPETNNVRVLPIGIEDLSRARNGMPWNFGKKLLQAKKRRALMLGPFGDTHPDRLLCLNELSGKDYCFTFLRRVPNWKYSRIASSFLFVACPRGNGLDTHRFWETILRGSIPVVLDSDWARNLRSYGVPMLILSSWHSLELGELMDLAPLPGRNLPLLSLSWWTQRFINDLVEPETSDGLLS